MSRHRLLGSVPAAIAFVVLTLGVLYVVHQQQTLACERVNGVRGVVGEFIYHAEQAWEREGDAETVAKYQQLAADLRDVAHTDDAYMPSGDLDYGRSAQVDCGEAIWP
jgi:hypothetical protein